MHFHQPNLSRYGLRTSLNFRDGNTFLMTNKSCMESEKSIRHVLKRLLYYRTSFLIWALVVIIWHLLCSVPKCPSTACAGAKRECCKSCLAIFLPIIYLWKVILKASSSRFRVHLISGKWAVPHQVTTAVVFNLNTINNCFDLLTD